MTLTTRFLQVLGEKKPSVPFGVFVNRTHTRLILSPMVDSFASDFLVAHKAYKVAPPEREEVIPLIPALAFPAHHPDVVGIPTRRTRPMQPPIEIHSHFKYMENKWADALLTRGSLRVGTLFDYRRTALGEETSDENEGRHEQIHYIDQLLFGNRTTDIGALEAYQNPLADLLKTDSRVLISDTLISRNTTDPDVLVYSTTAKCSATSMRRFGCDTCLEIKSTAAFYETLTEVLNQKLPVTFQGWRPVEYRYRVDEFTDRDASATHTKEPKYEHQYEVRATWKPTAAISISPLIVEDIRLSAFFTRIDPTEMPA
jgi:hypothetical protein